MAVDRIDSGMKPAGRTHGVASPAASAHALPRRMSGSLRIPGNLHAALGLFGAPLAWAGQVALIETHVRLGCFASVDGNSATTLSWLQYLVLAGSAVCFMLALLGTFAAWRDLVYTSSVPWDGPHSALHVREERAWLLARIGAMASTMFLIGLISTDLAVLIGASCVPV